MKRIVVIDDQETVCAFLEKALQTLDGGCEVSSAANGKEGLALIKKVMPDLVVLDVMMPDMDGVEVLKKIKHNDSLSHVPVIMLTGDLSDSSRIESLKSYAEAYLMKPVTRDELVKKVEFVLKSREPRS
jgi:DNA-binding response OmpR family regulator